MSCAVALWTNTRLVWEDLLVTWKPKGPNLIQDDLRTLVKNSRTITRRNSLNTDYPAIIGISDKTWIMSSLQLNGFALHFVTETETHLFWAKSLLLAKIFYDKSRPYDSTNQYFSFRIWIFIHYISYIWFNTSEILFDWMSRIWFKKKNCLN